MSDPTIFAADQAAVPPVTPPVVTPPAFTIPPEVSELVGVGKKYQTVEAALASLPHAQTHINTLESELAQLRDEVAKRKTTQELLDEIKSGIPTGATTPNKELSQDAVAQLVEQAINRKETQKSAAANTSQVVALFRETFGDHAEAKYNEVAAQAGISVAVLNQLASTSPTAVIKLAGITKAPTPPGKIKSDVNPLAITSGDGEISAKVKGTTSKDLINAWHAAGQKVAKSNLSS